MSDPYSALRDDYDKTWELLEAARAELAETQSALTAAEAAREAVAEQVRDGAVRLCEKALKTIPPKSMAAAEVFHLSRLIGAMALPTAALQRAREEARREGAERALRALAEEFGMKDCEDLVVAVLNELFPARRTP